MELSETKHKKQRTHIELSQNQHSPTVLRFLNKGKPKETTTTTRYASCSLKIKLDLYCKRSNVVHLICIIMQAHNPSYQSAWRGSVEPQRAWDWNYSTEKWLGEFQVSSGSFTPVVESPWHRRWWVPLIKATTWQDGCRLTHRLSFPSPQGVNCLCVSMWENLPVNWYPTESICAAVQKGEETDVFFFSV